MAESDASSIMTEDGESDVEAGPPPPKPQVFVLRRKNKVFLADKFYVEAREEKARFLQDLWEEIKGRRPTKYYRVQIGQEAKAKGALIRDGWRQEIPVSGGFFVPLQMAQQQLMPEYQVQEEERWKATMSSFLRTTVLMAYDEESKTYKETMDNCQEGDQPDEDTPRIYINPPEEDFLKGPPKKNSMMMTHRHDKPLVVTPSGQTFTTRKNRATNKDEWYITRIPDQVAGASERIAQGIEEKEKIELANLKVSHAESLDVIKQLRGRIRQLEDHLHTMPPPTHQDRSGQDEADDLASFQLVDPVGRTLITDPLKAVQMSNLHRSITKWSQESGVSAEEWLRQAIEVMKGSGVSVEAMMEVLLARLETKESMTLYDLRQVGAIYDTKSFIRAFRSKYFPPTTAMQRLREVYQAQMTDAQVRKSAFSEFGYGLQGKAHQAYGDLGLGKEKWEALDTVVVGIAFLTGIPQYIAADLMKRRLTTLEDMMKEAAFIAGVLRDTGMHQQKEFQPRKALLGGVTGPGIKGYYERGPYGNGTGSPPPQPPPPPKQQQQQQEGKKEDSVVDGLCPKCSALDPKPEYCDHCFRCGKRGHIRRDCRVKFRRQKQKPPEEKSQ